MEKDPIQLLREEFNIPKSMSNEELMNSFDRMLYMNSVELDIAVKDLRTQIRKTLNGPRYTYPSMPES